MKNSYSQKGFGAVAAIIILAIIVIIGLVMYGNKDKTDSDTDTATTTEDGTDTNDTSDVSNSGKGELRNLFAMSGQMECTFSSEDSSSESTGTVYIADSMMRGDFTTKQGTAMVESHMIKSGDMMHVWTGKQGAKMSAEAMMQPQTTGTNSSVDLDQNVDYDCKSWRKDGSKFEVPSDVTFMDVGAMMNATTQ